jgi:amino acid transporter
VSDDNARARPWGRVWRVLVGPPLSFRHLSKEQITPVEGLSALSLDALTSVAYGPEAIVVVLAVAGAGALHLVLPITLAIIGLLAILVFSYRQVIDAYPGGGGCYAVSRANLGTGASLLAGAALIVDYTLTVAVSIAAGVASLVSAFPGLNSATVPICLGILALVTFLNLRGLGDTARAFLLPTLVFIVGLLGIIAVGLIHPLGLSTPQPGHSLVPAHPLETVGVLLILKAFSAGCSALTGVEAIANGVPLFKAPRAQRAKHTEVLLGVILGAMLLGLAILAHRWHVGPRSGQTVLSQIMSLSVGRGWAYYVVTVTTTIVLALAANTSFGGLPVLGSLLARDHYLPHVFSLRGDRQVFSNGIWALAAMSAVLIVAVGGNTNELIPMFAIGVFTGFTLSQTGLVMHWRHERPPRWRYRAAVNGLGAVVTASATVIFLVTKFTHGAWVVVIAVPVIIYLFSRIHRYYAETAEALGIDQIPPPPVRRHSTVVVPVVTISKLTSYAIGEALSLSDDVVAVHVVLDYSEEAEPHIERLEQEWRQWHPGVPLRVLRSEFASIVSPIVDFIDELCDTSKGQVVVLIPVAIPAKLRHIALHNHLDLVLNSALSNRPGVVVARAGMRLPTAGSEAVPTTPASPQPAPPPDQVSSRPGQG